MENMKATVESCWRNRQSDSEVSKLVLADSKTAINYNSGRKKCSLQARMFGKAGHYSWF